MNTQELEILIEGCKRNDQLAQSKLYDTYYKKFTYIAYKYTTDPLIAEEVMNDGFLTIFNCINDYKHLGSFEGWMRIVITNAIINRVRTRNYNKPQYLIIGGTEDIDYIYTEHVRHNEFEFKDLKNTINITMELIPKSSRRVLKLAVIGYKYGEIANMLSLTENTVKWQVHEARKRLNILIGDKI